MSVYRGLRHSVFRAGELRADAAVVGGLTVPSYTVASAPTTHVAGQVIYVSNGAAGQPVLAFSNGTNWLRCDTRAAISAS